MIKPKVKANKTFEKMASEKVAEEVAKGDEKSLSSYETDDVFDVSYAVTVLHQQGALGQRGRKVAIWYVLPFYRNDAEDRKSGLFE